MSATSQRKVCLGVVIGAHGVRGLVKVKPFTDQPEAVAAYGPVETKDGSRRFGIATAGMVKGAVICRLEGVTDRDAAQALRGTELYVSRDSLPPLAEAGTDGDDESWYQADLIGLRVVGVDGTDLGKVLAVQNFGAGDLLEIGQGKTSDLIPFTRECVPRVDMEAGLLVVDPPRLIEGGEEEDSDG